MFVQHASKQNQAISKMHWTKSISAKNLAQNATASQVSSKCIRSHESLNKPYYKYVLAMIGAGTAGQSQEMPPLPPVGAEVRLVRISSESSFKWAYTLALAKQLMITRKKIKKGGFWKKPCESLWALSEPSTCKWRLCMDLPHRTRGFLDTYKWIDFPPVFGNLINRLHKVA